MTTSGIKRLTSPHLIIIGAVGIPILLGTFLLMLPWASRAGQWTGPLTALFMATSSMCVTGHALVDPGSYFSHFGQLVMLVLVQIGGLGFMTMAMALLIVAGHRLSLRNETAITFSMGLRDSYQIKHFLFRTMVLSLVLELAGAIILAARMMAERGFTVAKALYHGLFHSVCAFCNAGFSLYPDNLIGAAGDKTYLLTIIVLIVLGGIGFLVLSELYYKWRTRQKKHMILSLHSRMAIAGTIFLVMAGWIGFAVLEWGNTLASLSSSDKLVCALFQSVTARTAGFNVVDMAQTHSGSRFMTVVLMFIGGSPGSTAGGIKTTTAIVLIFTSIAMIRNQRNIVILGRTISSGVVGVALSVFLVSLLIVAGLFGLMLLTEQSNLMTGRFTFENLLFDAVSAFGTVGLSTGTVPLLSAGGKMIMIVLMFIGRVGPLTLALFIGMKEQRDLVRYPQEDVIIG